MPTPSRRPLSDLPVPAGDDPVNHLFDDNDGSGSACTDGELPDLQEGSDREYSDSDSPDDDDDGPGLMADYEVLKFNYVYAIFMLTFP